MIGIESHWICSAAMKYIQARNIICVGAYRSAVLFSLSRKTNEINIRIRIRSSIEIDPFFLLRSIEHLSHDPPVVDSFPFREEEEEGRNVKITRLAGRA